MAPLSWLRFEAGSVFGKKLGFNSYGVRLRLAMTF